jgi:uncharacterized protein (TIGR01244 family)|tara:strand:+ start:1099 stop:1617 length:519 start_codon:yes stop_codon:yes gene_type:complete
MKYIVTFLYTFLIISSAASATDKQVPFGSELQSSIKNYNRATSTLATSGTISTGGVKELAEKGFATIIDLRTENEGTAEEKKNVESAGMSYINIPVTGAGINHKQLAVFTKAIENTQPPILVHCASGNRVGALWTTYRLSKGINSKIAFEEGRTAGMKPLLEEKVRASCQTC